MQDSRRTNVDSALLKRITLDPKVRVPANAIRIAGYLIDTII